MQARRDPSQEDEAETQGLTHLQGWGWEWEHGLCTLRGRLLDGQMYTLSWRGRLLTLLPIDSQTLRGRGTGTFPSLSEHCGLVFEGLG